MKKNIIVVIILTLPVCMSIQCSKSSRTANSFYLRSCQTGRLIGPIHLEPGYLMPQLDEPNYIIAEPAESELEVRKCLLQAPPFGSHYFDVPLTEIISDINMFLKKRLGEKAPPVKVELIDKSRAPLITMSFSKEDKSAYDILCNIAAEAKFCLYVENGTIILSQKEFKDIYKKTGNSSK
jgi:hypothetical protein